MECPKLQWERGADLTARSSGSTGEPKTMAFERSHVIHAIEASAAHFGWPKGPQFTAWCPLSMEGIGGRMFVWRALHLGWSLRLEDPSMHPSLPASAGANGQPNALIDLAACTPHQAHHLYATRQLKQISQLLIGGGAFPAELEQLMADGHGTNAFQTRIHHTFGMTETLTHIAERSPGDPVYHVLPGITISSRQGRLVVDAPGRGVHGLLTHDEVSIDPERPGCFQWNGRSDNVINSDGLKVHPELLECQLIASKAHGHFFSGDFYLIGRPHSTTSEQITLVMPGVENLTLAEDLLSACGDVLPGPCRPRKVEWRSFTFTRTGKLIRA